MSSRKRQNSPSTDIKENLSKRARLLSDIWESQEETSGDTPSRENSPSSPVYRIKAIIGERSDSYLIDWANHAITGQSFKPDWQPKKNANSLAVQIWEDKKSLKSEKPTRRRRKQRRLRRQARSRRDSTASVSTVTARDSSVQSNDDRSPHDTSNRDNDSQPVTKESDVVVIQSPSLDTSNLPNFAVQISQHSSLDKDLYIAYYSSSSIQGSLQSIAPHPDSGLGESSPPPEVFPSQVTQTDGVVPDSQSFPGSSSYVPTSSLVSQSTPLSTNLLERPGIVIPASQSSISHSQRSRSAPASSLTEILSSIGRDTPPSLPRNNSCPTPLIQVPGSSERHSTLSKASDKDSPCQSSIFQTQIPLEYTVERSNLSLTPADHWPGGQAVSLQAESTLQSLPESISDQSRNSRSATGVAPGAVSAAPQFALRRSTRPETFEVLEDHTSSSHPSQATTTDDSILSLRNPNSQSSKEGSSQQKHEYSQQSYDSDLIELSEQDSEERDPPSLISIILPSSLDTREPPQPPSDSMADFSDHSNGSGLQRLPSIAEALRNRMQQIMAGSEAQLALQRAERQTEAPAAPYSPSLGQPGIEIQAGPPSAPHSPKGTMPARVANPQASYLPSSIRLRVPSPDTVRPQRSTESPLIIPEEAPYKYQDEPSRLEVEPSEILKDMPLPVLASQSVPESPVAARRPSLQPGASQQTDILDVRKLGDMEFIIPLSMPPRTQAQYIDTYRYYGKRIKRFLENRDSGRELVAELNTLLDRIGKVTTHMDLDGGGPSSQDPVDMDDEASYAVSCSEKFRFLGCLLDITRDDNLHVAIVARPGQLMDFIEMFLKAKKISYNRPDTLTKPDKSITSGSLQVSIIASGDEGPSAPPQVADLVIAFDETFNVQDPQVKTLRTHMINVGQLSPVIRLVVYGALEHIDLCLPKTLEPVDRLRKLIFFMVQTELSVGQLEPGEPHAATCAERVAEFSRSHGSTGWGIPAIRPLIDVSMMDSDATLSDAMSDVSDGEKSHEPIRYWPNPNIQPKIANNVQTGGKRPYDLEYGDSLKTQVKKQKLAENSGSGRIDKPSWKTPESLQNHLDKATEHIQTLTSEVSSTKARLEDYASWLEARQRKFEDDRTAMSALKGTNDDLTTALTKTTANLATANQTILDLKATKQTLSSEITSLHAQLLGSPNPEISTHESLRSQIATLEVTNAGQIKKITSLTRDFEFTRLQYQAASNAAVDATSELDTLKLQLTALERRADAQLSHLRETRDRDENAGLRKEVARLRDTVKQRDGMLRGKETDILELKRGRQGVQTRGSSVQPGVRSPKGGRSPRGGSRAGSPAVGLLGVGKALSGLGGRFGA